MFKSLTHGSLLLTSLLSATLLSSCDALPALVRGAETIYTQTTAATAAAQSDTLQREARQLVEQANQARQASGLDAFEERALLTQAAQAHAEDMARHNFFDHQGSDQRRGAERVRNVGYPHSYRGENIAYTVTDAASVIQEWLGATDQRENLLDPYTNEVGVGHAVNALTGRHYYVLVFGESARPALPLPAEVNWAEDPSVSEMAEAIRVYPGSWATDLITSLEIAQAAETAATQFGLAPRQLLAVWAHESQFGYARSEGNGAGLGQLTSPAIQELQRIGRGGRDGNRVGATAATYAMIRNPEARVVFDRLDNFESMISIADNAIGSAAYLRLMLDVHNGDQINTLRAYNGSGGAIERAYPGRVADAHLALFGYALPATLERR